MKSKKWIIIVVVLAVVVAAVAFVCLSGVGDDIAARIEEDKMWKSTGADLVEQINGDLFFLDRYGKINFWRIIEKSTTSYNAEDNSSLVILTLYCETDVAVLQIYASKTKDGNDNWRYRTESVRLK